MNITSTFLHQGKSLSKLFLIFYNLDFDFLSERGILQIHMRRLYDGGQY